MELGSMYAYISFSLMCSCFWRYENANNVIKKWMKLYVNAWVSISSFEEISFTKKMKEPIATERSWMGWPTVDQ